MIYLITIIFFNLNGEAEIREGWHPFEVPTLERCQDGKAGVVEYLDDAIAQGGFNDVSSYAVSCVEMKKIKE